VEFQEARASSREDPTQSVSASPMIANHQQQSTTEAPVRTISLEQKPEACSIMPPTRITPDGSWAVGLQVLNFIQISGLLKLVFQGLVLFMSLMGFMELITCAPFAVPG
jgi:hypothetical protein